MEEQDAQAEGEQLIIMADINEDVKGPENQIYIHQKG